MHVFKVKESISEHMNNVVALKVQKYVTEILTIL